MTDPRNVIDLKKLKVSCESCTLSELCLPRGLEHGELEQLDKIINRNRPLRSGDHVFRVGDHFQALYAVRSGSVKVYVPTRGGEEQVLGFALPGELLGLDAIEQEEHSCAAVALETTSVCALPYERLETLCHSLPGLRHQIRRLMGKEISQDHAMLLLLGKKNAEERLGAFLLSLAHRFKQRGYSEREFYLSMSRHDIGNYLGLAVETVSRLFTRFQEEGLLKVERRLVRIEDAPRLRELVGELSADAFHDHHAE